jgi:hypothetical protein
VGPNGSIAGASRTRAVKHLFDSDYVRPEDNYRVLQDDNPLKAAAFKDALSRYENDLKRKNDGHGVHMQQHKNVVERDINEKQREHDQKRLKQAEFRKNVTEQISKNVSEHIDLIFLLN